VATKKSYSICGIFYPPGQEFSVSNRKHMHLNLYHYLSVETQAEHFSLKGKSPDVGDRVG
jgi:hypothetical protein